MLLGRRRRRWANIELALGQRLVFAGYPRRLANNREYFCQVDNMSWSKKYFNNNDIVPFFLV